jgi:hypothetical protein
LQPSEPEPFNGEEPALPLPSVEEPTGKRDDTKPLIVAE